MRASRRHPSRPRVRSARRRSAQRGQRVSHLRSVVNPLSCSPGLFVERAIARRRRSEGTRKARAHNLQSWARISDAHDKRGPFGLGLAGAPPFDAIVVGGGIAGLLTAHRLLQQRADWRVAVLECAAHVGGRTHTSEFAGRTVSAGAGVGRAGKDARLASLIRELGLPVTLLPPTRQADPRQVARLAALQAAPLPKLEQDTTFREFARSVLGSAEFEAFVTTMGHTDMLDASARETMLHYGLDDNVLSWTPFAVPWNKVADRLRSLVQRCPGGRVFTSTRVDSIDWNMHRRKQAVRLWAAMPNAAAAGVVATGAAAAAGELAVGAGDAGAGAEGISLYHDDARSRVVTFAAWRVVLALPIDALRALLPASVRPCVAHVRGQPFLRVYARVAPRAAALVASAVKTHRVVSPSPLMKMSTVDEAGGVFMVAYADGQAARHLAARIVRTGADDRAAFNAKALRYLERLVADALELGALELGAADRRGLQLLSFKAFWFPIGTHYYEPRAPLQTARTVARVGLGRLFVVGEAVSHNQGWTEGALETVDAVLPLIA